MYYLCFKPKFSSSLSSQWKQQCFLSRLHYPPCPPVKYCTCHIIFTVFEKRILRWCSYNHWLFDIMAPDFSITSCCFLCKCIKVNDLWNICNNKDYKRKVFNWFSFIKAMIYLIKIKIFPDCLPYYFILHNFVGVKTLSSGHWLQKYIQKSAKAP